MQPAKTKYFKVIIIAVTITLAVAIAVALFYYIQPTEISAKDELIDPEDDVIVNIGEENHGIIDLTHAKLEINKETLNITITVKDPIPDKVSNGTFVQWMTRVIIQGNNFKAYEAYIEMNSTHNEGTLTGRYQELVTLQKGPIAVNHQQNTLQISIRLNETTNTKEIQWSVQTHIQRFSGADMLFEGYDFAPDESIKQIKVRPSIQ